MTYYMINIFGLLSEVMRPLEESCLPTGIHFPKKTVISITFLYHEQKKQYYYW